MDCQTALPSNDKFYVKINGANKLLVNDSGVHYSSIAAMSRAELKKNFEKLKDGLSIIRNTDIYKYNLKSEIEGCKKHIGFVIGDRFKYSRQITSKNNDSTDIYSMISVAYRAIQQQDEQIRYLMKQNQALLDKLNGKE